MTETKKPTPESGLRRIFKAFRYSYEGLLYAATQEAAFRQELLLCAILSMIIPFLSVSLILKLLLLLSHMAILVVELLNSGLEAIVDKASPEYHPLAKQAKDMGSAAVLLSFVASALVWGCAIFI